MIRSMSTTDYRIASRGYPEELPRPFHIYLKKPEKRYGAYWCSYCGDVMKFDSIADALAHGAAALKEDRFDVVPENDLDLPTYWDVRKGDHTARLIGTDVLSRETVQ
jgi:hypothetical protein